MMAGPAALAVQTGAALIPVTLWFTDDGWGVRFYDEVPVPGDGDRKQKVAAMTQQIARAFEDGIRAHPADWHMLQRVFVADLDPDRLAAADAAAAAAGPDAAAGQAQAAAADAAAGQAQAAAADAAAGQAQGAAADAAAAGAGQGAEAVP